MPVHKFVFGDKAKAADWYGFAAHKLRQMGGRFNAQSFSPQSGIQIIIKRVGKQEYISIYALGGGVYEFSTNDQYAALRYKTSHIIRATSSTSTEPSEFKYLNNDPLTLGSIGETNAFVKDKTVIRAGFSVRMYLDTRRSLVTTTAAYNSNNARDTYANNPKNTEAYLNTGGLDTVTDGFEVSAVAMLNGVLIGITDYGVVKATVLAEGATIKTIPVTVVGYTGDSTSFWRFNKAGDAAVSNVVSAEVNDGAPDPDFFTLTTTVVKLSFTAVVDEDDPTIFTVTAEAETVFAEDSLGADFYYKPAETDGEPDTEHVVTMIQKTWEDSTNFDKRNEVIDVETNEVYMYLPYQHLVDGSEINEVQSIILDINMRELSALVLNISLLDDIREIGNDLAAIDIQLYYNGVVVAHDDFEDYGDKITLPTDQEYIDNYNSYADYGSYPWADIDNSTGETEFARLVADTDNRYAAYFKCASPAIQVAAPAPSKLAQDLNSFPNRIQGHFSTGFTTFDHIYPVEFDIVNVGDVRTTHAKLYAAAAEHDDDIPVRPENWLGAPEGQDFRVMIGGGFFPE